MACPALDPAAEAKRESFWPDKDTCRRVLAAIRQAWERGQPWSMSLQARGRHAPKHLFNEFGIKPRDGDRMLETWLMNGVLTVAMSDPHTKTKGLKVTGGIDG